MDDMTSMYDSLEAAWKLPKASWGPWGHEAMRPTSTLLTSVGPCSVCIGTYARYGSVWSSHKVTLVCIYIYAYTIIYTYNIHPAKATFSYLPAWSDVTRSIPSLALHKLYMVRIVSDWVPLPLCPSMPSFAFWTPVFGLDLIDWRYWSASESRLRKVCTLCAAGSVAFWWWVVSEDVKPRLCLCPLSFVALCSVCGTLSHFVSG